METSGFNISAYCLENFPPWLCIHFQSSGSSNICWFLRRTYQTSTNSNMSVFVKHDFLLRNIIACFESLDLDRPHWNNDYVFHRKTFFEKNWMKIFCCCLIVLKMWMMIMNWMTNLFNLNYQFWGKCGFQKYFLSFSEWTTTTWSQSIIFYWITDSLDPQLQKYEEWKSFKAIHTNLI